MTIVLLGSPHFERLEESKDIPRNILGFYFFKKGNMTFITHLYLFNWDDFQT